MRIVLIGLQGMMLEGLRELLRKRKDMSVAGALENSPQTAAQAHQLTPDLIIIDIEPNGREGFRTIERIKIGNKDIRIIVLMSGRRKTFIKDMVRMGVCGYVQKKCAFEDLVEAIHRVGRGGIYLSGNLAEIVVREYQSLLVSYENRDNNGLTPREHEVLELVSSGMELGQIAKSLQVSGKTVSNYLRKVMLKLDVGNIAELTKYAIREGFTELD